MESAIEFIVTKDQENERIDKLVARLNEEWSRTQVQRWADEGFVCVRRIPKKGSYRVQEGDMIVVTPPPIRPSSVEPECIPLEIIYEDDDVIVVNKERGMVVHPGSGHYSGTLVNALLDRYKGRLSELGGVFRPGIVHRIDKDTSGILMVARNNNSHQSLSQQLKNHSLEREYIAIVNGSMKHSSGTIDAPIGRDRIHRQQMAVIEGGKPAITHFNVLQRYAHHTLVSCRLETGRTHQIRVHLKYIGHAIVGDPVYSKKAGTFRIKGQALHAKTLGFLHPRTQKKIRLEVDLPSDMQEIVNILEDKKAINP